MNGSGPLYDASGFPFTAALERAWPAIRAELDALPAAAFQDSPDSLTTVEPPYDERGWQWCALVHEQPGAPPMAARCPATLQALAAVPGLVNAGFSRFRPGTHLYPHAGERTGVLRCHLPLRVPVGDVAIRFGARTATWNEGRCLVFDDRHEHEAWNRSAGDRVVLIVTFRWPG